MKSMDRFRTSLSDKDGLNSELLPGTPIVEICDMGRVLVENHRGIVGYSGNEIRVKAPYGWICVCGECLKLSRMSKTKLVITGRILGVTLQER